MTFFILKTRGKAKMSNKRPEFQTQPFLCLSQFEIAISPFIPVLSHFKGFLLYYLFFLPLVYLVFCHLQFLLQTQNFEFLQSLLNPSKSKKQDFYHTLKALTTLIINQLPDKLHYHSWAIRGRSNALIYKQRLEVNGFLELPTAENWSGL